MSNNSKIQITCDLCERNYHPEKIKQVKFEYDMIFLYSPAMDSEHFICHDCLKKLGWSDKSEVSDSSDPSEETEKPADTPNAAGSPENNTSPAI